MRRSSVLEMKIETLHATLEQGEYVVKHRLDAEEVNRWQAMLARDLHDVMREHH
jgi:hypothetical protein